MCSGRGKAAVRGSYGIFHDRISSVSLRGAVDAYNGLNIQGVEVANPTLLSCGARPPTPAAVGDHHDNGAVAARRYAVHAPVERRVRVCRVATRHGVCGLRAHARPELSDDSERQRAAAVGPDRWETRVCPFGEALRANGLPECFQMQMQHDMSNRIHLNALTMRLERRFADRFEFPARLHAGQREDVVDRHVRHRPDRCQRQVQADWTSVRRTTTCATASPATSIYRAAVRHQCRRDRDRQQCGALQPHDRTRRQPGLRAQRPARRRSVQRAARRPVLQRRPASDEEGVPGPARGTWN